MAHKTPLFGKWLWGSVTIIILALWLAACSALDDIGQRPEATNTLQSLRTATFGGRVSVWIVSPTGRAVAQDTGLGTPPPDRGEVVGPVGTATAISATLYAATQTAAAPLELPNFQTSNCPAPSGRIPEPRPDSFSDFAASIGAYLSEGGPTSVLESELRVWGAITDQGGVVQDNTDLTGDHVPEIIVNLFNPFLYNVGAILNPGQLLVFGCDANRYRLLYQTPNSPGLALPVLHRVGDMNGDVKSELVFDIQSCSPTSCTREGYILTWNPITGIFEPLNNETIIAVNGRLGVLDIDGDGVLELTAASNPVSDITSGPRRSVVDIWDWTGKNYLLAIRQESDARYRVHILYDADIALQQRSWQRALDTYRIVRENDDLLAWTITGERQALSAFAAYRMVTIYARLGNSRAENMLATLLAENPEGTPGAVYAAMGNAFMSNFRLANSATTGCQAALAVVTTRPEALSILNSYGYANPSYTLADLCPF